tara:strand:+ start:30 stop:761 length:732 start_codon:yes stop_codon:yes gene_type:complete
MRSFIISLVTMMALAAQGFLPANANAIWVDFQLVVDPAKQGTVVSAFNKYKTTGTGSAFPGMMYLNSQVANGANPATHNLAVVYNNLKEWETRSASIASSPDFLKFQTALASSGQIVSETVYEHVLGFGKNAEDSKQFIGYAVNVSNAARYAELMQASSEGADSLAGIASIDLWAVKAGGQPGITHVVVIGVESRADYLSDPQTLRVLPDFQRQLSRVRDLVGITYVDVVSTIGQLGSSEIRK